MATTRAKTEQEQLDELLQEFEDTYPALADVARIERVETPGMPTLSAEFIVGTTTETSDLAYLGSSTG